jgi:hypothetical protein
LLSSEKKLDIGDRSGDGRHNGQLSDRANARRHSKSKTALTTVVIASNWDPKSLKIVARRYVMLARLAALYIVFLILKVHVHAPDYVCVCFFWRCFCGARGERPKQQNRP